MAPLSFRSHPRPWFRPAPPPAGNPPAGEKGVPAPVSRDAQRSTRLQAVAFSRNGCSAVGGNGGIPCLERLGWAETATPLRARWVVDEVRGRYRFGANVSTVAATSAAGSDPA